MSFSRETCRRRESSLSKSSRALAVQERLAARQLHKLNDAVRDDFPEPKGPVSLRMNARDWLKRLIVGPLS